MAWNNYITELNEIIRTNNKRKKEKLLIRRKVYTTPKKKLMLSKRIRVSSSVCGHISNKNFDIL